MQAITRIQVVEAVSVDSTKLEDLYAELGCSNAEDMVCRATEGLAHHLHRCEQLHRDGALQELCNIARDIAPLAEQIGMMRLAHVAGSVETCVVRGDPVALSACVARLIRAGEGALMAVWDLQDITI